MFADADADAASHAEINVLDPSGFLTYHQI